MKYLVLSLLFSCASYEHALHASLDATAIAANAAGQTTARMCVTQERLVVARSGPDSSMTYEQAQDELMSIRHKCNKVLDLYEQLRRAHNVAADLVESGQNADGAIADVVALWARVQEEIGGQGDSGAH